PGSRTTSAPKQTPAAAEMSKKATASYTTGARHTVSAIATRFGVSIADIVKANGLDSRAFIRVGQKLTIPGTTTTSAPKKTTTTSKKSKKATASYTVAAGDTVSAIATRFGVSIADIVKANGLDSRAFIRVGQKLTIPGTTTTSAPKKTKTTPNNATSSSA